MDGKRLEDRLLERVEALERENERWREQTGRLARALAELRARAPRTGDVVDGGRVSRRAALRLGAAAAAGTAAAAGGLVGAAPAFAGSDGDLALGSQANSASAPTGLSVSGSSRSVYGIGVTDDGLGAYPATLDSAALFGHAHDVNFTAGVVGFSDNGQTGVSGLSQNPSGTPGTGVYGNGSPGVHGDGRGGYGVSATGGNGFAGVFGLGTAGVHGVGFGVTATGVQGTNSGEFVGFQNPADGIGVLAECIDNGGGPPAASSAALSATNAGLGAGVKATSVSGTPVDASITNAANPSPAVRGVTHGSGPAVRGTQSGTTGNAVQGQVTNAKNAAAAVLGTGASKGRGGQFSGGAAQLRLVPAGTRPASGQTGDLFVDSAGHLHYCKAGGSAATWVQLA